jgi:hypothetical protein
MFRFVAFTAVTMKNAIFGDFTRATRRNIQEDGILHEFTNSINNFAARIS